MNIEDFVVKGGKVYSKLGNRIFGIMQTYCPNCRCYVRFPKKLVKKKGVEWLYCSKCESQLEIPHIEFDRNFKNKKELQMWLNRKFM